MHSYRHSIPVSATRVKSSTGNHHNHIHEDSFSDDGIESGGEPAFQTQNFLYELQSRCNNLQYEKTKNEMMHENVVNDLRNKIDYLQILSSNLSQQNQSISEERDLLRMLLAEVRQQNYSFSKEIGQLKIEINSIVCRTEKDEGQQPQLLQFQSELLKKDEVIESLQRQLAIASNLKNHQDKSFEELQKANKLLREEINLFRQHQEQSKSQLQVMKNKLCHREIQYQEERKRMIIELTSLREQNESKAKKHQTSINEELRKQIDLLQVKQQRIKVAENDRMALETKINELTLEVGRLKCQKNNLQQLNQYLQQNAEENEAKRKQLQQELFKSEKEMSDLRTQLFNEKIELKKQINTQKIEFQEQRIRYMQEMDEKAKEVNKLKEQNSYSNRHALDIQELSMKTQGIITDLDKANSQISKLTSENEALKLDLQVTRQKLQKKHEKYCNLQAKLKEENSLRVKALQTSIYKLQQANNELEVKLEILQRRSGSQESKGQNSKELFDLLKSQLKEKDNQIKQYSQRIRQLQDGKKSLLDEISKLQGQARLVRELKTTDFKEDRITTIELLNEEISSLKEQVSQQRQINENQRRQFSFREEKLRLQLQIKQKNCESYHRDKQMLENAIKKLEQELRSKEYRLGQLTAELTIAKQKQQKYQQEINNLKAERQPTRNRMNGRKYSSEYVKSEKSKQIAQEQSDRSQLLDRISWLQKENMSLKVDYSKSLQETNAILIRYQGLQQKHRRILEQKDKNDKNQQVIRIRVTQLESECQRLRQIIVQQQTNEKQLVKIINELKQQKTSLNYPSTNKPRRESEHLWLDKDYRLPERDTSEIHNTYRYHRHRI